MLDAAREALAFANGGNRCDLDQDRMLVLALVKDIEWRIRGDGVAVREGSRFCLRTAITHNITRRTMDSGMNAKLSP